MRLVNKRKPAASVGIRLPTGARGTLFFCFLLFVASSLYISEPTYGDVSHYVSPSGSSKPLYSKTGSPRRQLSGMYLVKGVVLSGVTITNGYTLWGDLDR
jgi:hypothetical protein